MSTVELGKLNLGHSLEQLLSNQGSMTGRASILLLLSSSPRRRSTQKLAPLSSAAFHTRSNIRTLFSYQFYTFCGKHCSYLFFTHFVRKTPRIGEWFNDGAIVIHPPQNWRRFLYFVKNLNRSGTKRLFCVPCQPKAARGPAVNWHF